MKALLILTTALSMNYAFADAKSNDRSYLDLILNEISCPQNEERVKVVQQEVSSQRLGDKTFFGRNTEGNVAMVYEKDGFVTTELYLCESIINYDSSDELKFYLRDFDLNTSEAVLNYSNHCVVDEITVLNLHYTILNDEHKSELSSSFRPIHFNSSDLCVGYEHDNTDRSFRNERDLGHKDKPQNKNKVNFE